MAGTDQRSLARAARSLRCLPFRRGFYEGVGSQALSSQELAHRSDWTRLSFRPLSAERAEGHFLWLIRLGVLRREVDGQGLTERVRLTPMGRQVLEGWPAEIPRAGRRERILEGLRRHRPRC
ncbi:Npun_F0494 family protein [Synechococcus sp. CCY 9618]|uniref:Npun_F0494 family protein n=1 Tax=Synechococcus sp. CCY 9618 TaxID=2815602 RepID=UPI00352F3D70